MSLGGGSRAKVRNRQLVPGMRLRSLGMAGHQEVVLVDGPKLRDLVFIDFTEGGNTQIYPWLPLHEIWIDICNEAEAQPILLHELAEWNRMRAGASYDAAHNMANVLEQAVRSDASQYHRLIAREIEFSKQRLQLANMNPFKEVRDEH